MRCEAWSKEEGKERRRDTCEVKVKSGEISGERADGRM